MNADADEAMQRREPDGRRGDVDEPAGGDPEGRDETGRAALVDALRDDVGHGRPGHDDQGQRGGAEERDRRQGGTAQSPAPFSDHYDRPRVAEDADRRGARARRRAGARLGAVPRRRQQPRLPRVLRAPRGARDERRPADERAARLHEHALQAARRLPAEGRRRRLGLAAGAPGRRRRGGRRRLQGGPQADAGPAARAVPALPADRRGVRLPEPRVRGLGGRRRDRDARDPRRRRRDQDLRRLDRPRRVPALLRERLPDDDAARRRRRPGLHARARLGALRRPARPDPGLHRPQGRHVRQHPRRPRDRRQDRRPADRPVRLARGGDRARRRAVAGARAGNITEHADQARIVEGARDDAPRPRPRLRSGRARPRAARPLAAEGDLPPLRVPRPARPGRQARRGAAGRRTRADRRRGALARGPARPPRRADRPRVADGRLAVATGDEVSSSERPPGELREAQLGAARRPRREGARRRRRPTTRCSRRT